MLVLFVPGSFHNLARMRFVLFDTDVNSSGPNVVFDVESKERAGLSSCLGGYQIVKGNVVGQNQILLDVQECVCRHVFEFAKVSGTILADRLQKVSDGVSLGNGADSSMAGSIPVTVGNLEAFLFHGILGVLPFLFQPRPFGNGSIFTFLIGKKGSIDGGILLAEFQSARTRAV